MSSTYQVFARKYRPRTFGDVLGQDHVVQTLRNAIEQDRLANAYLFVGPRGTGKTSTARILAKAMNCPGGPKAEFDPDDPVCREIGEGNSLDVLEIDGASNNSVDDIRSLREAVQFAPSSGKFRIYYIDEVHMLSNAAFNALLKTLEEPPPHVKFIFATTEAQKILPTIISRCQRFDLRRIPTEIIAGHLLHIAKEEGLALEESAAFAIARGAEGGMRDAQSMLDQMVAFCGESIAESQVLEIFGFNSAEAVAALGGMVLRRENSAALEAVHDHAESGKDLSRLLGDLIGHFRNVLVLKVDPVAGATDLPLDLRGAVKEQAALIDTGRIIRLIDILAETDARMKWAANKKLHLEIGLIKAIQAIGEPNIDDVISLVASAASAADSLPILISVSGASSGPGVDVSAPLSMVDTFKDLESSPKAKRAEKAPETDEPEPVAPKSSGGGEKFDGVALWEAARAALIDSRPLFETWLSAAVFVRHDAGEFVIGFSPEQRFFRESLSRYEKDIEEQVNVLATAPVKLLIEVRDDIAPVEMVPLEENEPEPVGADLPAPNAPEETPSADGVPSESESSEDFKKDPLIEKALEAFEARVIQSKTKS